jgi:endonuclease YncB( thermonuclease family)
LPCQQFKRFLNIWLINPSRSDANSDGRLCKVYQIKPSAYFQLILGIDTQYRFRGRLIVTIGSDTFTYGITDGQGGGTMATIHVTVTEDLSLPPAQVIDYLLKEKLYPFEATFVNDGDTVQGNAHLGFGVTIHETVRLLGINCPTMNTVTGQLARARVQEILFEAAIAVRVQTESTGKYGRWLGTLWYQDGNTAEHEWRSLNQLLIDENLATEYDGNTPAT